MVNGFGEARSEASGGGVLGEGQPTPSPPARGSEGAL